MIEPGGERAHRRCASALGDDRRLEFIGAPAFDRLRDRVALASAAEDGERRLAMAGGIGVQADPAVDGGIVAGDWVPHRRRLPALRPDREAEPQRREAAVDDDLRRPRGDESGALGDRERGRADRRGGEVADRENRGQVAFAAIFDAPEPGLIPAERAPGGGKEAGGRGRGGMRRIGHAASIKLRVPWARVR